MAVGSTYSIVGKCKIFGIFFATTQMESVVSLYFSSIVHECSQKWISWKKTFFASHAKVLKCASHTLWRQLVGQSFLKMEVLALMETKQTLQTFKGPSDKLLKASCFQTVALMLRYGGVDAQIWRRWCQTPELIAEALQMCLTVNKVVQAPQRINLSIPFKSLLVELTLSLCIEVHGFEVFFNQSQNGLKQMH